MKADSEVIVTTGLADELAYRLQRKILAGEYPPGTHLPQDEICKSFGVSRTPVREALRKLQAQHLVVVVPNRGAKVRVLTQKELVEIYTVRAELEGFSCELAVQNLTEEVLATLRSCQTILDEAVSQFESGRVDGEQESAFSSKLNKANDEFHSAIHRAARNQHLQRMIEEMHQFFPKDYVWQGVRMAHGLRELNIGEHCRIIDALVARDATGARAAMKSHVLHSGTTLLDYLQKQQFWK